jgi:cytochrome c553
MNPPSLAGDTAALAVALEKSAAFAPPGYANWASISNDGAKAAKAGNLDAAKASCRSCHDQYKKKYQAEMRARKI